MKAIRIDDVKVPCVLSYTWKGRIDDFQLLGKAGFTIYVSHYTAKVGNRIVTRGDQVLTAADVPWDVEHAQLLAKHHAWVRVSTNGRVLSLRLPKSK